MKGHVHELDSSDHTTFEILRGSHPQDMALKIQVPQFSPSPRPLASSTVTALSSFLMSILDLTKKKAKRRRSLRVSRMIWKKFETFLITFAYTRYYYIAELTLEPRLSWFKVMRSWWGPRARVQSGYSLIPSRHPQVHHQFVMHIGNEEWPILTSLWFVTFVVSDGLMSELFEYNDKVHDTRGKRVWPGVGK